MTTDVNFNSETKKVSGIFGDQQLSKIKGWESYTTGLGGSVKVRLGHAQGVASYDHNTVSIDEPLRLGRFIGIWLKQPNFFHKDVRDYWNYFMQDKILEVSGLSDNEISTMTKTTGSVNRTEEYAGMYKENNGRFTIKVPEVKGSPVRKLMKYYISGISDPVTGVAHFHGNTDLRFSKVNYGGDFLYILLGPTMRPDDIEFSCLWVNAFPTKDFIQHLNSGAIGEPGAGDLTQDIEFAGSYVQNSAVNKIAQIVTTAIGLFKESGEEIVLPSYIYEQYLDPANIDAIRLEHGSNVKQRLSNAAASPDADVLGSIVESYGKVHEAPTEITIEPGSGFDEAGTNFTINEPA